jgi:hypothetical protein
MSRFSLPEFPKELEGFRRRVPPAAAAAPPTPNASIGRIVSSSSSSSRSGVVQPSSCGNFGNSEREGWTGAEKGLVAIVVVLVVVLVITGAVLGVRVSRLEGDLAASVEACQLAEKKGRQHEEVAKRRAGAPLTPDPASPPASAAKHVSFADQAADPAAPWTSSASLAPPRIGRSLHAEENRRQQPHAPPPPLSQFHSQGPVPGGATVLSPI